MEGEEEEEVAYLCSFYCPFNLYIPNMSIQTKILRINPRRRRQSNGAQLQKKNLLVSNRKVFSSRTQQKKIAKKFLTHPTKADEKIIITKRSR